LALGLGALLLASYARFMAGAWNDAGSEHGPVVVAIALFLFWHQRQALALAQPPQRSWPGFALIGAGLLLFLFGVRTRIAPIEALSHLPLVAGSLWLLGGPALVKRFWLALLFLLLSVPPPSFVLATTTATLKDLVSTCAVELLYRLGYPIARDGYVITIGTYQLLVAEACSGMNSIISLSAVGLVYLYLVPQTRLWKIVLAVCSIVPIAIGANVVRIVILTLVTYHFGDAAGQGFLHEFAGFVMFGFALVAFGLISVLLEKMGPANPKAHAHA
jgi:exosortase